MTKTLLALAALTAVLLGATASIASAAPVYDIKAVWGNTNLPPGGRGLLEAGSLLRFDSTGAPLGFTATPTHPAGVAVNPVNGNVYAIDIASPSGGGATLRTYTPAGVEAALPCPLEWAPDTPLPEPGVDAAGNLYYPNTQTGTVQKLESGCAEVPLAHPIAGLTNPDSVALDAAGDIYVVDGTNKGTEIASGRLTKYAPDGTPLGAFAGLDGTTAAKGEVAAVALDRSTGDVYVGRGWGSSFRIGRYSATGTLLKTLGAGGFSTQRASEYAYNQLAVNETSKVVYAANAGSPVSPGEVLGIKAGTPPVHVHTGGLTSAVAVNQASADLYAASAGRVNDVGQFEIQARNLSTQAGSEAITITDQLPAGVKARAIHWMPSSFQDLALAPYNFCSGVGTEAVTCVLPAGDVPTFAPGRGDELFAPAGYLPLIEVEVEVTSSPPANPGVDTATIEAADAPTFTDTDQVPFSPTPSAFGLVPGSFQSDLFGAAYPFGAPSRQAGAHPFEQRVGFDLNARTAPGEIWNKLVSDAPIQTVEYTLPRGMIGNPEALPKCNPVQFAEPGSTEDSTGCPANTQIGYLNIMLPSYGGGAQVYGKSNEYLAHTAIYNLVPPRGTPTDFAFNAAGFVQGHIYAALDPARDYAIKTLTPEISAKVIVRGSEVTFWGVPADPAHDTFRYYPKAQPTGTFNKNGVEIKLVTGAPFEGSIRPFFTNPMDCGAENGGARIRVDSYTEPGSFTPLEEWPNPDNVEECNDARFRFEPEIKLQPTDRHAGAPTGLDVHLEVPQRNDEVTNADELYEGSKAVQAIATPPIKKAVVTLPEGMTLNPSAAQGLGSCTLEQIGIEPKDGRYVPNDEPVRCPDSSQYGTLTIHTPILPENAPPTGYIYIAKQNENPFGSFLALYLAIEDPERGILVKIPGRVDLNPETGQITTTFEDLPQFPMSDMQMSLKSGVRSGLVEPATCGPKTIETTFYTWQDPSKSVPSNSSYEVTENPDGSPCAGSLAERPFNPALEAGTLNPLAGAFSPLLLRLTRTDEDQELSVVEGTAPPGLTASLRGITQCTEAQIAAAANPARTGAEELEHPSCPASSQVGTVDAGAGTGQTLTWVKGRVYLAGPYKGAPVSGVAIVPAVAGPFDLGVIVTRAPAYVNPETAQISLKTDPLPLIFKGVPVRVRDIRVHLNRPNFTLNPTSCEAMSLNGTLFSSEGKSKASSNRFQVADCASLGFKPSLSLKLKGGTKRGALPALRAVLKARPGDANIAAAQVTLPHSEFLEQAHLNNICTRVQFKAHECPASSVYGYARAITPLFDSPLEGPVYLRSSSHNLPDLVAALKGPATLPVEVALDGRVDSIHGGIRNTFEVVPDAPVSEFTLSMQGGAKGLLVNSENICARTFRATARFKAQNGRAITLHPALRSACARHPRKHNHKHHARSGR